MKHIADHYTPISFDEAAELMIAAILKPTVVVEVKHER